MGHALSLARRNAAPDSPASGGDYEDGECEMPRFSNRNGAFFGSHFLMGGERYEVAKPEAFLFGDNSDLDLLGTKPTQFPYSRQAVTDPVRTLNALINVRRDSVKFIKIKNDNGNEEEEKDLFHLEFYFDCDSACYVQIHFCAKEIISDGRVQFVSKYPNMRSSEQYFFDVGAEQHFDKFIFDPSLYDIASMHYESGAYFPVVIELCTVDCGVEQVQTTMASIDRATDQSAALVLKPLKQKLVADGVVYLLQEIYGIENKDHDLSDENGSECIICMSDIRDTVILPCRHLCICNGCAETLRYKASLNNCPICRSPFRALLQLKTMRVVSTVSITDQSSSTQQTRSQTRYETMTLVEALNGPVSHIQSCVLQSGSATACEVDGYDLAPPYASNINRLSSPSAINIQQVLTLNAPTRDDEDDNTVYIEMKAVDEFTNRSSTPDPTTTVERSAASAECSSCGSAACVQVVDECPGEFAQSHDEYFHSRTEDAYSETPLRESYSEEESEEDVQVRVPHTPKLLSAERNSSPPSNDQQQYANA
ncbi:RING finger protein [Toxocara canis]|uniref:RING finger protein n=1 Tax=Toxocara canis TaxID=6265 RepID=A0A0B2W027_TOXCA|nr:RING finger protein [Toxocara canis]